MEKSSVFFNSNTQANHRDEIVSILEVKEVKRFETYLGLPNLVGWAKYQAFSCLKDRVWKKLLGWKGCLLSKAGKEVLIKAVAKAISTYTMGVFQLPVKLCDELNALCAKFWWGQVGNERKIHSKSWTSLSQPKNEGGMGFRDLRSYNLAMLGKQGWRLMHEKDLLLYKCFKARYFPRCHFLDATVSPNSSFVWRSIMVAMPILKSGCCWRVGSGDEIQIRKDEWIPSYPSNMVLHPVVEDVEECMVVDLIDPNLHYWRRDLIMAMFHINDTKAICNIPLS